MVLFMCQDLHDDVEHSREFSLPEPLFSMIIQQPVGKTASLLVQDLNVLVQYLNAMSTLVYSSNERKLGWKKMNKSCLKRAPDRVRI